MLPDFPQKLVFYFMLNYWWCWLCTSSSVSRPTIWDPLAMQLGQRMSCFKAHELHKDIPLWKVRVRVELDHLIIKGRVDLDLGLAGTVWIYKLSNEAHSRVVWERGYVLPLQSAQISSLSLEAWGSPIPPPGPWILEHTAQLCQILQEGEEGESRREREGERGKEREGEGQEEVGRMEKGARKKKETEEGGDRVRAGELVTIRQAISHIWLTGSLLTNISVLFLSLLCPFSFHQMIGSILRENGEHVAARRGHGGIEGAWDTHLQDGSENWCHWKQWCC